VASANEVAEAIARDLKATIEGCVVEVTTCVTNALTLATPEDTGWAEFNWMPSIGQPAEDAGSDVRAAESRAIRESLVPGAAVAQTSALADIAQTYQLEQGDTFITDAVPYLERLDAGFSSQAPAGFVEATIEQGVAEAVANFKIVEGS
jgi:hypothetical protein